MIDDPIQKVLEKLECVRPTGDGKFMARCPSHDDGNPSLSISRGEDGKALLKCFARCKTESVVAAIGLTLADLMPKSSGRPHANGAPKTERRTFATSAGAVADWERQLGTVSKTWTYTDGGGEAVGIVLRWDTATGKTFRPVSRDSSGRWTLTAMESPRPLYRLGELTDATTVVVTEGEKASDSARSLGFTSTTSVGGSGAPAKTDWRPIADKDVLILIDNDPAGRQFGADVAAIGVKLAPPARVKVLLLPDLPEGGDVLDWIDAHGDAAEPDGMREEIETLAANVEPAKAEPTTPTDADQHDNHSERLLHPLSDIGNGHRFIADHGGNTRYVADWGCWCVWDGVRWVRDGMGAAALELAKASVKLLLAEGLAAFKAAGDALADAEGEDAEARAKIAKKSAMDRIHWAKKSHGVKQLKDMLAAARTDRRVFVPVGAEVFDTRRDLLNVLNGVVDLRKGQLRPHRREDFLTVLCPTKFDPAAQAPIYLKFLADIFPNSPTVAEYVRKLSGYAITGEVSDQALYLFVGNGSNGKSVLLELWPFVLGAELCYSVPAEVLLDSTGERHPTERAGFRGARLAVACETQEEAALAEARIKSLTGGDRMTARFCRQDFFTFPPTHTLIATTNHRPRVRGTDDAIWRRVRLIDFPRRFWKEADKLSEPERQFPDADRADPRLIDKLKAEAEGVLADAVKFAVQFYAGVGTIEAPVAVMRATANYRTEEDSLGQFFKQRIASTGTTESTRMTGAQLRESYVNWNRENGHNDATLIGSRKFGERAKHLFKWTRIGGVVNYYCEIKRGGLD